MFLGPFPPLPTRSTGAGGGGAHSLWFFFTQFHTFTVGGGSVPTFEGGGQEADVNKTSREEALHMVYELECEQRRLITMKSPQALFIKKWDL